MYTGVATELKVMAGSEMEMVGVTAKSEVMVGSEVEMVVSMESGVDTKVGSDLKLMVDMGGNVSAVVGAKVGMGCEMASVVADARVEMGLMVAGTDTGDDVAAVVGAQVGTIVETILSACAAVSKFSALANVQLGIFGMGMETVEQSEVFMGMGMVLSACVAASEVSVPANAQLGNVVPEMDTAVGSETGAVTDVHAGMSPDMVTVAEGASTNMATLAVSVVGWMEQKT